MPELFLLGLMYQHNSAGDNPTYEGVKMTLAFIFPDIDPDVVITNLHKKNFVEKADKTDYRITGKGKAAMQSKMNLSLDIVITEAVRMNLSRKVLSLLDSATNEKNDSPR